METVCYLFKPTYNGASNAGSFTQCFDYCASISGATMLCIHHADENTWVESNYMYPAGWIGYTDDKAFAPTAGGVDTRQYAWVTGCSSTYTHWGNGEPNGGHNSQFTKMWVGAGTPSGTWNDVPDIGDTVQPIQVYCGCQTMVPTTTAPTVAPTHVMGERK